MRGDCDIAQAGVREKNARDARDRKKKLETYDIIYVDRVRERG